VPIDNTRAISGNIGVGKSTLSALLGERIANAEVLYEQYEDNQYLPLFYEEMERNGPHVYNKYAFPSQMTFMASGLGREKKCIDVGKVYVIDRSLYEDRYVFAQNQHTQGLLNDQEFDDYIEGFNKIRDSIEPFDIAIYLRASTDKLLERIQARGREMEKKLSLDYLQTLEALYQTKLFPALMKEGKDGLLIFDVDDLSEQELADKAVTEVIAALKNKGIHLKTTN